MSFHAAAATFNGLEYHSVSSTTTACPDGTKPLVSNGVAYCRTYKAAVAWIAPTKRTDGSALTSSDLQGYEVYWTRTKDSKSGVIKVTGAANLKTALSVYTPDTYNFAVSAIDSKGLKSPLSPVVAAKLM